MKFRQITIAGSVLLVLLVALYINRRDKLYASAISNSGAVKAELYATHNGFFGKKYCLRVTTIKTGVKVVNDEQRLSGLSYDQLRKTKLTWRTDSNLEISLPDGTTEMVWFNNVGPPPQ